MLMKGKDYNVAPDQSETDFLAGLEQKAKAKEDADSDKDSTDGEKRESEENTEEQSLPDDDKDGEQEKQSDDSQRSAEQQQRPQPQPQQPPGAPAFNASYGATEALINGVTGIIGGTILGAGKGLAAQGKKMALFGMNTARAINNINPIEHLSAWRQNIAKKEHSLLETRVSQIDQFLNDIADDPVMKDVSQKVADGQIDFQDAKNEIGERLDSDDPEISQSPFNKKYQAMMEEIKAMQKNDWLGTQERMRRANDQTALAMSSTQEKFETVLENPVLDKLPDDAKDRLENIKKSIKELMTKIREFFSKLFGVHTQDEAPKPSM
jgi:hypothetical protein